MTGVPSIATSEPASEIQSMKLDRLVPPLEVPVAPDDERHVAVLDGLQLGDA